MTRKDVTPKQNKNKGFSRFLIGVLGGVVGCVLTIGIYNNTSFSTKGGNDSAITSNKKNSGEPAKISDVKLNVNSDTTKAVEKVQGAVVSVINLQQRKTVDSYGGLGKYFGLEDDAITDDNGTAEEPELETTGEGSGVIYKKNGKKAYIVTNNHVVAGSEATEVLLNDGTKVAAKIVGTDVYSDLAVLEIDAETVKDVAEFGDSDALKVGEPALAMGSPLGSTYANSVTQGIVSAKGRNITNKEGNNLTSINAIQTDAAINPGNSGGPLINIAGQVIGINSIKIAQATSNVSVEGMGFAIPSNDVVKIITQLEKDGKVSRPQMGIRMIDVSAVTAEQQERILKLPKDVVSGVALVEVAPAAPAEQAGLKQYDVIIAVDDQEITNTTELQSYIMNKNVGDKIKVTFYREKEKKTVDVELSLEKVATP